MQMLTNKGIIEMLAMMKAGIVTALKDEYDNIVGINCNKPDITVKDIKYTKKLMQGTAVGTTLEELREDEEALCEFARTWSDTDVMHLLKVADVLNKDNLTEEDVDYLNAELKRYVDKHKEVVTRTVTASAQNESCACRGRYPDLLENLYVLDVETLKEMKRQATRNGANDLKNACRTVLRHKGVSC